jgi:hypothetical protein
VEVEGVGHGRPEDYAIYANGRSWQVGLVTYEVRMGAAPDAARWRDERRL